MRLIKRLADNSSSDSLATSLRRRRFAFFLSLLGRLPRPITVLDVGGTQEFWVLMGLHELRNVRITLLNLQELEVSKPGFEAVQGDARDLSAFDDASFDVVFSNSVIEHLGPRFEDQRLMANEIRRVGKRYFVQTPNRYFPIEPHFLTPGFQFWPASLRAWTVNHLNVGWYRKIADKSDARREVESISLLTERQVRDLFPEAAIYKERFAALTKSFVAYGGWQLDAADSQRHRQAGSAEQRVKPRT
ncbi:MAG TPA: class I SAM-dependent methyltransferase [Gemmatimonadaceae bacterium]|nr:class I SAM-dependent methyltransferase [Gemmatimonadaceae bacterium]